MKTWLRWLAAGCLATTACGTGTMGPSTGQVLDAGVTGDGQDASETSDAGGDSVGPDGGGDTIGEDTQDVGDVLTDSQDGAGPDVSDLDSMQDGLGDALPDSSAKCGNAKCDPSESLASCAFDCSPETQMLLKCGETTCKSELEACAADSGCIGAFNCAIACEEDKDCAEDCLTNASPAAQNLALGFVQCAEDKCFGDMPFCGDGDCDPTESKSSCPLDCNDCGNGVCDPGESDINCFQDCIKCGDGKCSDFFETASSCSADCPAVCGDGDCTAPETEASCLQDCKVAVCGDNVCDFKDGESPSSCPADCPPMCGDGQCDPPETDTSCAQDCKVAVCGDNACDDFAGEDCQSCNQDCGPCVPSTGCNTSPMPKCGGCACETCVCAQDPYCCQTAWDGACTSQCAQDCGQPCP